MQIQYGDTLVETPYKGSFGTVGADFGNIPIRMNQVESLLAKSPIVEKTRSNESIKLDSVAYFYSGRLISTACVAVYIFYSLTQFLIYRHGSPLHLESLGSIDWFMVLFSIVPLFILMNVKRKSAVEIHNKVMLGAIIAVNVYWVIFPVYSRIYHPVKPKAVDVVKLVAHYCGTAGIFVPNTGTWNAAFAMLFALRERTVFTGYHSSVVYHVMCGYASFVQLLLHALYYLITYVMAQQWHKLVPITSKGFENSAGILSFTALMLMVRFD